MMTVVAQAMMLNVGLFTNSPISSFLLMSSNMKISTKGNTAPLTTCENTVIFTSGIPGIMITVQVERGRAGHNDEPGNYVGEDAADNHVELRRVVLTPSNSFFHDGRLEIELHPGRDRRSNHADHHVEVGVLLECG